MADIRNIGGDKCGGYVIHMNPSSEETQVKRQPWYKERLRTKYVKKLQPGESLNPMVTKNWVLLRPKMDDFRDGYPPDFEGVYFLPGRKGVWPSMLHNKEKDSFTTRLKKNKLKNIKQRPFLTKEQIESDRKIPLIKMREDHIKEVEYGLTQHPLALYPHLEEGMPPELFDELVDILDPAMNPESSIGDDNFSENELSDNDEDQKEENPDSLNNSDDEEVEGGGDEKVSKNHFAWMVRTAERDEITGEIITKIRPPSPPTQDEHIKQVTREFCDWVSDLGGESNNIEESTVMSLFASGYETKPALSVPIHVVELSYIPAELRETAGLPSHEAGKKSRQTSARQGGRRQQAKTTTKEGDYEPSWVRTKYGAWYLKPNAWKVMKKGEELEDPKKVQKREQSESKKKSCAMDSELSTIHGSRAFREFLERKQRRMPVFMSKVAALQDIEDEEAKKEAMLNRKKGRGLSAGWRSRPSTKRTTSS